MISCDLRSRIGAYGQKCRLSDIREAEKTYVRYQLELKDDFSFLRKAACLSKVRSLTDTALVMNIAASASAALCSNKLISVVAEILHQKSCLLIDDKSTDRHLDIQVLTLLAVAFSLHSVLAVLSLILPLVIEVHQSPEIAVGNKNNTAAVTAVAAVRTAVRNVRVASECDCAVAALTGYYCNFRSVYEHIFSPKKSAPTM